MPASGKRLHRPPPESMTIRRLLPIVLVLLSALYARGQSCVSSTCNAATPAFADVVAALPAPGNTNATVVLNIPSGTANWSTGFVYTLPAAVTNFTIQGNTTVNCTGTAGTAGYSCTATDNTVIQDVYTSNNALMYFNLGNSSTKFRITGLTWGGGAIGGAFPKFNGWVEINSGAPQVRLDHNHLTDANYSPANQPVWFRSYGPISGVADHNRVDQTRTSFPFTFDISAGVGDTIGNGDGTFALPTAWGAATSFYIEANYVVGGVINDCDHAGAFVARYNSMINMTVATQTHATKSVGGSPRGCRMYEAYRNYISNTGGTLNGAMGSKNTTALIWGNILTASSYYNFWTSCTDRQCDTNPETNTPNGWGYCGASAINPSTGFANGTGSGWDGTTSGVGYPCLDGIGRGQTPQSLNGASFPGLAELVDGDHRLAAPVPRAGLSLNEYDDVRAERIRQRRRPLDDPESRYLLGLRTEQLGMLWRIHRHRRDRIRYARLEARHLHSRPWRDERNLADGELWAGLLRDRCL